MTHVYLEVCQHDAWAVCDKQALKTSADMFFAQDRMEISYPHNRGVYFRQINRNTFDCSVLPVEAGHLVLVPTLDKVAPTKTDTQTSRLTSPCVGLPTEIR